MDYASFVNIVGKEKVEKLRRMNDIISQENDEEFFTLFLLWEYFQENRDHTMILSDESRFQWAMIVVKHAINLPHLQEEY
jgi:hypothetical protein